MDLLSIIWIVGLGLMLYFLMIRPQKKQQQQRTEMIKGAKVGDTIVTIGGLHGVLDEVNEAKRTFVLDCEGVYLTFDLNAIARVVVSATPTESVEIDVTEEIQAEAKDQSEEQ